MRYAVKVIWDNGEEELLKSGNTIASFASKRRAQEIADFMKAGMDEVQSINVVRYPKERKP